MSRTNRRRFLKHMAAASLTAPLWVRSSALGRQNGAAANDRIAVAMIGMGRMNFVHLAAMLDMPDVQVVGVCDVDATRRDEARRRVEQAYGEDTSYRGCAAVSDHGDLLKRDDVDAVVIATPDHWHAAAVLGACNEGKGIYCEKPLTLTIREASLCVDAVRKFDVVLQTGSQLRSDPRFCLACSLVRSGRIGRVERVEVTAGGPSRWCDLPHEEPEPGLDWDRWLGPAPTRGYHSALSPRGVHRHFPRWRDYREYSGGRMTDWGAHYFDIAQWGLGMDHSGPVEVLPPDDPAAETGVRLIYDNNVEVVHGGDDGVRFIGTDGEIAVDRNRLTSTPAGIVDEPLGARDVHLYQSPGHFRNWIDCIHSRKRPICDVEIGARSATLCHLGNLAYWHRRPLAWDAQRWEFVDDAEANHWLDRERRELYQLPSI